MQAKGSTIAPWAGSCSKAHMDTPLVDPWCQRCGLAAARTQVVQPEVPSGATVLFIGRDPGKTEDKGGQPFTGRSGKLLRGMIAALGVPAEQCAFHNVAACHTPKDRGPTKDEMRACRVWLRRVLTLRDWKAVVVLGKDAEWAVGEIYPVLPAGYVGAPHPSAGLRNRASRRTLAGVLRGVAATIGVAGREPLDRLVTWSGGIDG